eukprot:311196_1
MAMISCTALNILQTKYDVLEKSYSTMCTDLKAKNETIEALTEQNKKLQTMLASVEANMSQSGSVDSCSAKNIYENNFDLIHEAVTEDEYKYIHDLSREKHCTHCFDLEARSSIIKRRHTDSEHEFFLLSVLSAKIDLATKGCSNAAVSDVSPPMLWNTAQEECLSIHQFHDWIMNKLLNVYQDTQHESNVILHTWNSNQIVISTETLTHKNNETIHANNIRKVCPQNTNKYTAKHSPKQLQEEAHILTDDDSDIDNGEHDIVYLAQRQYRNTINV